MVVSAHAKSKSAAFDRQQFWLSLCLLLGRNRNRSSPQRIFSVLAAVTGIIVLGVLIGHRTAAHYVNARELVVAPINSIARDCPLPTYPVLDVSSSSTPPQPRICVTTLTDTAQADMLQRLLRWRNFDQLLDITWPNKQHYCNKHGYKLYNESHMLDQSRPPSWSKIRAVRRLLVEEPCDWVFWMDADTVIMNSAKRIEEFLPQTDSTINLLLTREKGNSWNAGAWLIRNTQWSLDFLDLWWNMTEFILPKGLGISGDNDALKAYLTSLQQSTDPTVHNVYAQRIGVPERCTFNSIARWNTPQEAAKMAKELIPTDELVKQQQQQSEWFKSQSYYKGDFVAHIAGTSFCRCLVVVVPSSTRNTELLKL